MSRLTSHVPEQHQSVRPPRTMALMLLGVIVLAIVIALGVGLAVTNGGDDCNSRGQQTTSGDVCR